MSAVKLQKIIQALNGVNYPIDLNAIFSTIGAPIRDFSVLADYAIVLR